MNRHLFRLVFNCARGLLVAVQESATGRGKSARGERSGARTTGPLFALLLCASLAAQAQIVADPGAPGNQRPTVLAAPNGVPVVNIQTPTAAGVSHNTYRQFDVGTAGAVLNNSRGNAQSQLGGWLQGNPWLGQGSARVILNEVNSNAASRLHGAIEVLGPRTEVIIANPSGIVVDGGSFINVGRITLTTGTPVMQGGDLESYRVQRGGITIEGRGLDAGSTDYAALLARAVQVNAGVWAHALTVGAGAQEVSADGRQTGALPGTGPAPAYALDVAALGGMFADHIFLVGTEAGLGVRNAGTIASTGALSLSTEGWLANSGSFAAASSLTIETAGDIVNTGGTLEGTSLHLRSATGDIDNRQGVLRQTSGAALAVTANAVSNTDGGFIGSEPLPTPPTDAETPSPPDAGAGPDGSAGSSPPVAPPAATPAPTDPAPGTLDAAYSLLNDHGQVFAGGAIDIETGGLDNRAGTLNATRVTVNGPIFRNLGGTVEASEMFQARVGSFDNSGGTLGAASLTIDSQGDLLNRDGSMTASGTATLAATGTIDNTAGRIASGAQLSLHSQTLVNTGTVRAGQDADIAVSAALINGDTGEAGNTGGTGGTGDITSQGHLSIEAGSLASDSASTLGAGILADGSRAALGDLSIHTTGTLAAQGQNIAAGDMDLQGGTVDLSDSRSFAENIAVQASRGDLLTNGATVYANDRLGLSGQAIVNHAGSLQGRRIDLAADSLDNSGTLRAGQDMAIRLGGALDNHAGGDITAQGRLDIESERLGSASGSRLAAGLQADGTRAASGDLHIATTGALVAQGHNIAGGALSLQGASVDLTGSRTDAQAITVTASRGLLTTNEADVTADGALTLTGQAIVNEQGRLQGATLDLSGSTLDNTGILRAGQDLNLRVSGEVVNHGGGMITAQGRLGITAGSLESGPQATLGAGIRSDGTLADSGDLDIRTSGALVALGQTLAAGGLSLQGSSVDLSGSQTFADGVRIAAIQGDLVTRGATVATTGILKLTTLAGALDNRAGRIVATGDVGLQALRIDNVGGLVSAGQDLTLDAGRFDAEGSLFASRDLSITTAADIDQHAVLSAGRDIRIATEGDFRNHGVLHANATLSIGAADLLNEAGAELSAGGVTALSARGTLSNRGLIDGHDTRVDAGSLENIGTGRIYGDHLSIAAGRLLNAAETVAGSARAGTIAARDRLDIAAATLTNQDGALIFSAGDIAIGGTLDAARQATGRAAVVSNTAASIEATGHMRLGAERLDNLNTGFSARQASTTSAVEERYVVMGLNLEGPRYTEDQLGRCRSCDSDHDDALGAASAARFEYVTPSATYPFEAGFARHTYPPETVGDQIYDSEGNTLWGQLKPEVYGEDNPVWALFHIAYGDRDALNLALGAYNTDYMERAHRDFTVVNVTQRTVDETVVEDPGTPGRISAGGHLSLDIGSGRNVNSQILAGGALEVTGGALGNEASEGHRTVTDTGTWRKDTVSYYHYGLHEGAYGTGAYADTIENRTTTLSTGRIESYSKASPPSDHTIDITTSTVPGSGAAAIATAIAAPSDPKDISAIDTARRPSAVVSPSVPATAPPAGSDVRTTVPDIHLPTASLFSTGTPPGSRYLIETDPRFTDYREWISSDYLLTALGIDPASTAKRLGDGFYEQMLVRDQLAQLTGRRLLDGYANDDSQYATLLSAGATAAQALALRPGIALTATQIAQLTSDIVWLVTQTVTLPDGSQQQVLVPQVYVQVRPGDLDGEGSLLAGRSVDIRLNGDLQNIGGTIAGREVVGINAATIANLGGRITGDVVGLQATADIGNIGGTVDAGEMLRVDAGRDLNIRSTTASRQIEAGASSFGRTGLDRVAGLYLTGAANGVLIASAGHDINLVAGVVANASADGTTQLSAGNDLRLGTAQTGSSGALLDGRNASRNSRTDAAGSQVQVAGDLLLDAGRDIAIRSGNVDAGRALQLEAGRDVTIEAGQSTTHLDQSHTGSSSGFLSSRTQTRVDVVDTTAAGASRLGGGTVVIAAGQDITIGGSQVIGDGNTTLTARRDIAIVAATDTRTESHDEQTTKTGLIGASGAGITLGTLDHRSDIQAHGTTASASTVGSIGSDVTVVAGGSYTQTGSNLRAPQGDIAIQAGTVAITEARETRDSLTTQTTEQSGITVALGSPVLGAVQSTMATTEAVGHTGSARMQALGAASAAMNIAGAADAAQAIGANPATAASVAISLGQSSSTSTSAQSSDTARGSQLTAGGDLSIRATGAGADSDILIRGADLDAGRDLRLQADGDIALLAAQNSASQHSDNRSSGGSLGLSLGAQTSVIASANVARGHTDGDDVSYLNTHLSGGQGVGISSGGDTTVRGAVVTAPRVSANVGGDLLIESLQDTSTYRSRNASLGASLSIGTSSASGSLSASRTRIDADYASVVEQSGIQAGDGGFDVNVHGRANLIGSMVASSQAAVDAGANRFESASLNTADIQNHDHFDASGLSLSGGYGSGGDGAASSPAATPHLAGGVNGAAAGIGSAHGDNSSTTTSGISSIAGNTAVRTGDDANGLVKTFDAEQVNREIAAQVQITSTFGQQAASAWSTYANSRMTDAQTPEERACWGADGACRVAGHAVIAGLGGGIGAAIGTAASTSLAPAMDAAVSGAGLTGGPHDSVVAGLSAVIGATVGGGAGAAGAFNEVTNNYLTSRQWQSFADELGACQAHSGGCEATEDAAIRARYQNLSTQQNIAMANCEKTGNCAPLRADVTSGTDAMLRLAASGAIPIGGAVGNDMGQYLGQRLANDPAYRATVNNAVAVLNACNAISAACTQQAIRAAALVLAPLIGVAGLPITPSAIGIGGGLGGVTNIVGQLIGNGGKYDEINGIDAALGGATGAITFGGPLLPSLFANASGALILGSFNNSPSDIVAGGVLGSTIGTLLGFPVGLVTERGLNTILNPWYRNAWRDIGLTIQQWAPPNKVPSVIGIMGGSLVQEGGGIAVINNQHIQSSNEKK